MRKLASREVDRILTPVPQPAVKHHGGGAARGFAGTVGRRPAEGAEGANGPSGLMALQGAAGNRAVAQLVAGAVVQRHPGPTENAEVQDASESEEAAAPTEEAAAPTGADATDQATTDGASGETAAPSAADETSQPGTGTTGSTGSTGSRLTGPARKKAIEDTCRGSDTGMWAMSIIEKWKIPVDYEFGGQGSYHQGGSIYVNKTLGIGGAALTLMHEAQHADTFKSGKQADRTKLARDEYIRLSIADEAEAVVRQIEGLAVTTSLGVDLTGAGVNEGLKQRYLTAFNTKRDELKSANPTMTTGEINRRCRAETRDGEVTKWFHDGTFVTSTNNNNYAVFYGNQWDEVHKTPGRT